MSKALLLGLFAALAAAQDDFADTALLQVRPGVGIRGAVYRDVNGDRRPDLVVSEIVLGDKASRRVLAVHLQREKGPAFRSDPDFVLEPVWKDVVAFAVADVHEAAGAEVVLFGANGVWAWRPGAPEKERPRKLCSASLLWQVPNPSRVLVWADGLIDLDGDGKTDLAIPEPDGYRLLVQRRDKGAARFEPVGMCLLPHAGEFSEDDPRPLRRRAHKLRDRIRFTISLGRGAGPSGPLLDLSDGVPAPQWADFDGDGDLDLLVATEESLLVWKQDAEGRFPDRPGHETTLPVRADEERRLDVSYSAHVGDLNRDGKVDCIVFAGDQRSKKVRTQVQVFLQDAKKAAEAAPLFGKEQLPTQLLVLAGFGGDPRLDDVDGDGYPDLFVGTMRPDLLDSIQREGGGRVQIELHLFLNRRGTFSRRPDLTYRMGFQAEGLRLSRRVLMARFFGDVTGDGVLDLLVRDTKESLKLFMTRKSRDRYSIFPKPLWKLRIASNASVHFVDGARGSTELLILESQQILRVRFP